jgi:hypothetical protein
MFLFAFSLSNGIFPQFPLIVFFNNNRKGGFWQYEPIAKPFPHILFKTSRKGAEFAKERREQCLISLL